MNYTVICYRPDGEDNCRGCSMGRSPSDFELLCTKEINDAATLIADKRYKNITNKDREVFDWELYLLINGCDDSGYLFSEERELIESLVTKNLFAKKAADLQRIEAEKKKEEDRRAAAEARRLARQEIVDKETYLRLKERYERPI